MQLAFSAYLQKILLRLKGNEFTHEKGTSREILCDVILQFLHTISQNLTMPLQFKVSIILVLKYAYIFI